MPLVGRSKVEKAIDKLISDKDKALRGAIFQTVQSIQLGTPVDTGRARSNWFLTTGSESTETTASVNGNAVKFNEIPSPLGNEVIYFTNNLPYISRLEYDGWSDQAAAGWVRVEMLKLRVAIKNI